MLTLSEQAKTALLSAAPRYVKRVSLRRRRWAGSAYELMPELDVTGLLAECGTLKWKLDTETYGVWTLDNCSLVFANLTNEWKEGNPAGLFPEGTLLYGSVLEIRAGIRLADGSEEMFGVFRGQVKQNPVYNGEEKTVSLTVYGSLAGLKDFSAESISVAVTDELLGSDAGGEFTTDNVAAGIICAVKKGGTAAGPGAAETLVPSADYSVADLNARDTGAVIKLKQELLAGQSVWVTYKYWHTDKTIEWVVAQLCAAAGVTDTLISPAVFACDVKNSFCQTSAEDFDLGTDSGTDHCSGDVKMAAVFVPNVTGGWTVCEASGKITGWYNSAAAVTFSASGQASAQWGAARQAQPYASGTWQATFNLEANTYGGVHYYFYFMATGADRGSVNGYCLKWNMADTGRHACTLYRADSGALTALWGGTAVVPAAAKYATVRVSRTEAGTFSLWVYDPYSGWQAMGAVARDGLYSSSENMFAAMNFWLSEDTSCYMAVTGVSVSPQVATGYGLYPVSAHYTTPVIDGTDSLVSWRLAVSESKPEGTATVLQYQSSPDSLVWSEWTAVPATGELPVTDRYVRVRWNASADVTQTLTPALAEWTVYYYTSRITIPVVNMTGLTCYDALCGLAEMCAYETGFDSSGRFVFRPRVSTLSPCGLVDETNVLETVSVNEGIDRVYNSITVNFGEYSCTADCDTQQCARPHSRDKYGTRALSVSSGNFLPAENTDLAYAAAPTIFGFTAEKRRQATLKTMFMPWFELGDKVTVKLTDSPALTPWVWGAARYPFGYSRQAYYSASCAGKRCMLYGLEARIDGIEFDLENYRMTLNLTQA